jgi:protein O-mannosyl-transferase
MPPSEPRPLLSVASIAVALAALLAYAGTLAFDFVWDDTLLIQRSHQLHYWKDLWAALTTHFWAEVQERSHYYRPVVTASFFLDLRIWGLNPLGFHLTNVLAHLAVSLAVLALARRLTGSEVTSGAAGLLFALHPLHVESVAFVSGRTDILATLGFVLALLGYATWRETGRRGPWAGSLVAFAFALGAKEVAVVLVLVLVLHDWWRGDFARGPRTSPLDARSWRAVVAGRALARYAPYALVVAAYVAVRGAVLGGMLDQPTTPWAPLGVRLLTGLEIIGRYVCLAFVPYPANAYYPIFPVAWPPGPGWWLVAGVLAVALVLTAVAMRRWPAAGFGAAWFWITLAPATGVNFLALSDAIMAERFLYLPSVGFCLVGGVIMGRVLRGLEAAGEPARARQVPALPALTLALVFVTYAGSTLWRAQDWKDDYRLYLRMVETSPQTALPHVNLGFTQMHAGEVESAREHLTQAVAIRPRDARALAGLGLAQTVLGERDEGLRNALAARSIAPRSANVLATLGAVHLYREEPGLALSALEASLALHPNQVNAVFNRALALAKLGRHPEAEAGLAAGFALSAIVTPGSAWGHRVAAEIYARRDPARERGAWEQYIAWLRRVPEPSDRHRADLAYAERRLAEALSAMR